MKLLRILLILGVVLDFLDPTGGLFRGDSAAAQTLPVPYLQGPQQVPAAIPMVNSLIQQLNAILVPVLGPSTGPGGVALVNNTALTGGVTGSPAVIGLQPGADANASIQIKPNGTGNIVLFGQGTTAGVLQFASSGSFVPATGFAACPGVIPNKAPLGVQGVVTSYLVVQDWLGNKHGWATC